MSVFAFSGEEIGSIYKTLQGEIYGRDIYSLIPKEEIDYYHVKEFYENDMERLQKVKLIGWVSRIWIANQCAVIQQYGANHPDLNKTIELFDDDKCLGKVLDEHELYRSVSSLIYNLYTNGGNCFVQKKDLDFANHIINTISQKHTSAKFREIEDSIKERTL